MSDETDGTLPLAWPGRLLLGQAVTTLCERFARNETRIAALEAALSEKIADAERMRLSILALERRLDAESKERDTVARALFERIERLPGV